MSQATALRETPAPAAVSPTAPAPVLARRKSNGGRRFALLVVVPAIAVAGGLAWWVNGGRYVSTDNAYVGADKALITPYVTGPILAVHVTEGQHVKKGDALFDLDPAPYQTALALAKGKLEGARVEYSNLRQSFSSNTDQLRMNEDSVRLKQADLDRKRSLLQSHSGTQSDLDTSQAALLQDQEIAEFVRYMLESAKVKLGGGPDVPIEKFPNYMMARAAVDDAMRNLGYTHVVAPIDGVATQVANIELGRVAPAGQAVFAVVADQNLWVDANPKESDLTFVKSGQPATVTIDTYPDRLWKGHVCSIAPGTGAQFAILPPQNASGNWVKVVQRIPLRFCFDPDQDMAGLRAGMSSVVSVDTGRVRSLGALKDSVVAWGRSWVEPARADTIR